MAKLGRKEIGVWQLKAIRDDKTYRNILGTWSVRGSVVLLDAKTKLLVAAFSIGDGIEKFDSEREAREFFRKATGPDAVMRLLHS